MTAKTHIRYSAVFGGIFLVLMTSSFGEPNPVYGQEVLRGLDLSIVGLDLRVPGEFRKSLEERAQKQFHDAGLKLGENNFPSIKLSLCKLPRQGDTSKGEVLASRWARYMAGGIPSSVSWGRSSLYSCIHWALISRTCSSESNT